MYKFKLSLDAAIDGYLTSFGSDKAFYRSVILESFSRAGSGTIKTERYAVTLYTGCGGRERIKIKANDKRQ